MVEMPDLMDMTAVQAYNALTALGLNMVCSPDDPYGVVLGQSIYAGTMVEYGSSVTLYFGIKPEE